MGDKLSTIIDMSVAAIVGIIIITAAVIPIAVSQIDSLNDLVSTSLDIDMYQTLLGMVIVFVILALVIGIIKYISGSDR